MDDRNRSTHRSIRDGTGQLHRTYQLNLSLQFHLLPLLLPPPLPLIILFFHRSRVSPPGNSSKHKKNETSASSARALFQWFFFDFARLTLPLRLPHLKKKFFFFFKSNLTNKQSSSSPERRRGRNPFQLLQTHSKYIEAAKGANKPTRTRRIFTV